MIIDNLYPNIRSSHAMGMLLECLLSLAQWANFFSEVAFLFYSTCAMCIFRSLLECSTISKLFEVLRGYDNIYI